MKRIVLRRAPSRKGGFRPSRIWRLFAISDGKHRGRQVWFVDVYLGRLALMAGVLGVVAYMSGTVALFLFWNKRPYNQISYMDVFLPTRWGEIRGKQGQMLIAHAEQMLAEEKYREAFHLLRSGLRFYPADQEARLKLAGLMVSAGMVEQAGRLLVQGLDQGYPENPEYLGALFQIIKHQENLALVAEVVPVLLRFPQIQEDSERKYGLMRKLMFAQHGSGRYLEMLALAERINADPSAPFKAHDIVISAHMATGAIDEAHAYLISLPEGYRRMPVMMVLEASVHHERGERAAMINVAERLFREHRDAWMLQSSMIVLLARAGEDRWVDAYIDSYLSDFRGNPDAITRLASSLVDLPDSSRVNRMMTNLVLDMPDYRAPMMLFQAQALVAEGRFSEARQIFDAWRQTYAEDDVGQENAFIFDLILTAAIDKGQGSPAALIDALRERRYVPKVYWDAALAMKQSGQTQPARTIINLGLGFYPSQPSLLNLRQQIQDGGASQAPLAHPLADIEFR